MGALAYSAKETRKCHFIQPHRTGSWAESFTHVHLIPAIIPMTKHIRQGSETEWPEFSPIQPTLSPSPMSLALPRLTSVRCSHTALPPPLLSPCSSDGPGRGGGDCRWDMQVPGQQLSWWQAQEFCDQRFGHLALGLPDGVLTSPLPDPIWVAQRKTPLQRPPRRHECGPGQWERWRLWRPP